MKKGMTTVELLCVIAIISILLPVLYLGARNIISNYNKYQKINYELYELTNFFDIVNLSFDIGGNMDYEIDGENLYLSNGSNFLLLYNDHTVFNQENYDIHINHFKFIDHFLIITFKGYNYDYDLIIRGNFHEINYN